MLFFTNKEEKVVIAFDAKTICRESSIELTFNTPHEIYAELLRKHLNNLMQKFLNGIAEYYYKQGWRDAKAKVKKQAYFWVNQNW
jgi:hypothetical protein